jgi:hypothetical protein
MVNLKLSGLLDEGRIVQEQLIKILQRHEDALGNSSSTDTSQGNRITALETAIGSATGDNPSGLAKDVSDVQTAIGSATGDNPSGIAKDVSDIQTAIGDASTEGTILARLKALEDAQNTNTTPSEP